jgi:hypothetical protein
LTHGAWFVLLSFRTTGFSFGINAALSYTFLNTGFEGLLAESVLPTVTESGFLVRRLSELALAG